MRGLHGPGKERANRNVEPRPLNHGLLRPMWKTHAGAGVSGREHPGVAFSHTLIFDPPQGGSGPLHGKPVRALVTFSGWTSRPTHHYLPCRMERGRFGTPGMMDRAILAGGCVQGNHVCEEWGEEVRQAAAVSEYPDEQTLQRLDPELVQRG